MTPRLPLVALGAALLGLLAGCGGGSATTTAAAAPSSTTVAAGTTDAQPYLQCLVDHGVPAGAGGFRGAGGPDGTLPTGGSRPVGTRPVDAPGGTRGLGGPNATTADGSPRTTVDPAVRQAALDACAALRPADQGSGGDGAFGAGPGSARSALAPYLSCLKDHGVDTGAVTGGPPAGDAPPTSLAGAPGIAGAGQGLRGIDAIVARLQGDPAFAAAQATCQALLPSAAPSTTSKAGA